MLVTGAVCQYVLTFTGVRIPLVTGLVLVSGGLFCYTRRTPDASYAAGMLPGLLLTAAGAGLACSCCSWSRPRRCARRRAGS